VLCAEGPVKTLVGLSLAPEHRRGHGALYDAVNRGRIDFARLRRSLAGLPLPWAADGRLMVAVDVSSWLRPGAATSPQRLFCHVYGVAGAGADDPGLAVLGGRGAGAGAYPQPWLARRWPPTCASRGNGPRPGPDHPGPRPRRVSEHRATTAQPAGAPKTGKPGPRPPGSKTAVPPLRRGKDDEEGTHAQGVA